MVRWWHGTRCYPQSQRDARRAVLCRHPGHRANVLRTPRGWIRARRVSRTVTSQTPPPPAPSPERGGGETLDRSPPPGGGELLSPLPASGRGRGRGFRIARPPLPPHPHSPSPCLPSLSI